MKTKRLYIFRRHYIPGREVQFFWKYFLEFVPCYTMLFFLLLGFPINAFALSEEGIDSMDILKNIEPTVTSLMRTPLQELVGQELTWGQYCSSDGTIIQNDHWCTTEKISIPTGAGIQYTGFKLRGNAPKIVVFNSEDQVIKSFSPTLTRARWVKVDLPDDAASIVFSIHVDDLPYVNIYIDYVSTKIEDKNNLNIVLPGKENECWSWWNYPQVVSFHGVRNKVYWGYTTADGYSGIAEYDYDTHNAKKNNLIFSNGNGNTLMDDHNACAVLMLEDGKVLISFGGHANSNEIIIRKSVVPECIENFGRSIIIETSGDSDYSQLIQYNGKIYLFYRVANTAWAMRSSSDEGETWTEETAIVTSSMQYYCKFVPTTIPGVIRICMYSNPSGGDTNIREGFIHLDTGIIYNSDNLTNLGINNVAYDSFNILIENEMGKRQRLLDVAITAPESPLLLFASFITGDDSVYKIFDSGSTLYICQGGSALVKGSYMLGASWIGKDKIVLSRESNGSDIIELYHYQDRQVELDKVIYEEPHGSKMIRNARPIADINGEVFLWQRGYYNRNNYSDWNMDAIIWNSDGNDLDH